MKKYVVFGLAFAFGVGVASLPAAADEIFGTSTGQALATAYPVLKDFPSVLRKLNGGPASGTFTVAQACNPGYSNVCRNGDLASSECGCGWIGYTCICNGVFGWWSDN